VQPDGQQARRLVAIAAKNPRRSLRDAQRLRAPAANCRSQAGCAIARASGMYRACIAVVDASRARLFTFQRVAGAEGLEESLVEERDLVNPARRLRPQQLFSESRPGSSRTGDLQYALDDHRDAHIDALDTVFARLVIEELVGVIRAANAPRLILCASPRMLGALRDASQPLAREGIELDTLDRDLVKLTPAQLREHLVAYRLLPEKPPRAHA
jgi:protein required for attachment to host cells